MPRPFLFVMDPIASVHPGKDTTFDFLLESQRRGSGNYVCGVDELITRAGKGYALCAPVTVRRPTAEDPNHFVVGERREMPFDAFRVIWMRKDPPVDEVFLQATMLLDRYDPAQTLMMNEPSSLRVANEKLFALFAAELFPHTTVSSQVETLVREVERLGKAVVKPLTLAGGAGVMVFESGDRNLRSALDLLTFEGKRPALVQEYLPAVRDGDKRVILIGGEPVGAVLRVPSAQDHRANMHVGGSAAKGRVDDQDRMIAERLKPELLRLGLHFVGLDVIGGKLTEVNVTSPTGVQEIDQLDGRTGSDCLSYQVMDYVERLCEAKGLPA